MTRPRILIVDDERMIADSLRMIFEHQGFDAQAAYTGDEGLARALSFQPDLVLSDFSMPGMNGLTMATRIADEQPGCSVLILTGNYLAIHEMRLTNIGLTCPHLVLAKPVHPEVLLREAQVLLRRPTSDARRTATLVVEDEDADAAVLAGPQRGRIETFRPFSVSDAARN